MKIRNGFVSNSSSSSFIVAFPKVPNSRDEIKKIVLDDKNFYEWDADIVAQTVWDAIEKQEPITLHDSPNAIDVLLYKMGYKINDIEDKMHKFKLGVYKRLFNDDIDDENDIDDEDTDDIDEFLNSINTFSSFFYVFDFSDNDSRYFSDLEHKELFQRLPYLRISKH